MPMRPVSIRDTLDADQPRRAATSLPCQPPVVRSVRSSRASRRSRTEGASTTDPVCPAVVQYCNPPVGSERRSGTLPVQGPDDHRRTEMTAPQLSRTSLAPVAAAWLAGGQQRAVDALLVSRLERHRIAVVDGNVVDRGLDRNDAL